MSKANKIYNHALNLSRRKAFLFFQKMGLHLTPNHFYIPIPDTRKLKMDLWKEQSDLDGIDINEEEQIKLLSMFSSKFKDEYEKIPRDKTSLPHQYYLNNGAFLACDNTVSYEMKTQSVGKALFGGTGGFFIMHTSGQGDLLINAYGDIMEINVDADHPITIDNEHVIAWDDSLDYEIKIASGTFGFTTGEGLVNEFHGNGKVYIQSRNLHSLADALIPFIPQGKN